MEFPWEIVLPDRGTNYCYERSIQGGLDWLGMWHSTEEKWIQDFGRES
jgi:hypothetical protein